jgi:hypothetical protein
MGWRLRDWRKGRPNACTIRRNPCEMQVVLKQVTQATASDARDVQVPGVHNSVRATERLAALRATDSCSYTSA